VSIVSRVINILTKPKEEWEVIKTENANLGGLLLGYAAILMAITALIGVAFAVARIGDPTQLAMGTTTGVLIPLLSVLSQLGILAAMSFITNALTPSFNGKKDLSQSAKLMVYAGTPTWIMAILGALITPLVVAMPLLSILSMLLIYGGMAYSVYLTYLGLNPLLEVPENKVAGMTVTVAVIYFIAMMIAGFLLIGVMFANGAMDAVLAGAAQQ
jgi:hypothetical protein